MEAGEKSLGKKKIGGPHGVRTHDLIVANDALSQTELAAHVKKRTDTTRYRMVLQGAAANVYGPAEDSLINPEALPGALESRWLP